MSRRELRPSMDWRRTCGCRTEIAQSLKASRHVRGALSLETIEAKPIFDGDQLRDLEIEETNRARQIIEDFMIAANGVTARYLSAKDFPSIRRVVRTPKTLGPDCGPCARTRVQPAGEP